MKQENNFSEIEGEDRIPIVEKIKTEKINNLRKLQMLEAEKRISKLLKINNIIPNYSEIEKIKFIKIVYQDETKLQNKSSPDPNVDFKELLIIISENINNLKQVDNQKKFEELMEISMPLIEDDFSADFKVANKSESHKVLSNIRQSSKLKLDCNSINSQEILILLNKANPKLNETRLDSKIKPIDPVYKIYRRDYQNKLKSNDSDIITSSENSEIYCPQEDLKKDFDLLNAKNKKLDEITPDNKIDEDTITTGNSEITFSGLRVRKDENFSNNSKHFINGKQSYNHVNTNELNILNIDNKKLSILCQEEKLENRSSSLSQNKRNHKNNSIDYDKKKEENDSIDLESNISKSVKSFYKNTKDDLELILNKSKILNQISESPRILKIEVQFETDEIKKIIIKKSLTINNISENSKLNKIDDKKYQDNNKQKIKTSDIDGKNQEEIYIPILNNDLKIIDRVPKKIGKIDYCKCEKIKNLETETDIKELKVLLKGTKLKSKKNPIPSDILCAIKSEPKLKSVEPVLSQKKTKISEVSFNQGRCDGTDDNKQEDISDILVKKYKNLKDVNSIERPIFSKLEINIEYKDIKDLLKLSKLKILTSDADSKYKNLDSNIDYITTLTSNFKKLYATHNESKIDLDIIINKGRNYLVKTDEILHVNKNIRRVNTLKPCQPVKKSEIEIDLKPILQMTQHNIIKIWEISKSEKINGLVCEFDHNEIENLIRKEVVKDLKLKKVKEESKIVNASIEVDDITIDIQPNRFILGIIQPELKNFFSKSASFIERNNKDKKISENNSDINIKVAILLNETSTDINKSDIEIINSKNKKILTISYCKGLNNVNCEIDQAEIGSLINKPMRIKSVKEECKIIHDSKLDNFANDIKQNSVKLNQVHADASLRSKQRNKTHKIKIKDDKGKFQLKIKDKDDKLNKPNQPEKENYSNKNNLTYKKKYVKNDDDSRESKNEKILYPSENEKILNENKVNNYYNPDAKINNNQETKDIEKEENIDNNQDNHENDDNKKNDKNNPSNSNNEDNYSNIISERDNNGNSYINENNSDNMNDNSEYYENASSDDSLENFGYIEVDFLINRLILKIVKTKAEEPMNKFTENTREIQADESFNFNNDYKNIRNITKEEKIPAIDYLVPYLVNDLSLLLKEDCKKLIEVTPDSKPNLENLSCSIDHEDFTSNIYLQDVKSESKFEEMDLRLEDENEMRYLSDVIYELKAKNHKEVFIPPLIKVSEEGDDFVHKVLKKIKSSKKDQSFNKLKEIEKDEDIFSKNIKTIKNVNSVQSHIQLSSLKLADCFEDFIKDTKLIKNVNKLNSLENKLKENNKMNLKDFDLILKKQNPRRKTYQNKVIVSQKLPELSNKFINEDFLDCAKERILEMKINKLSDKVLQKIPPIKSKDMIDHMSECVSNNNINSYTKKMKLKVEPLSNLSEFKTASIIKDCVLFPQFGTQSKIIKNVPEVKRLGLSCNFENPTIDFSIKTDKREIRNVIPNNSMSAFISSINKIDEKDLDCIMRLQKKIENVKINSHIPSISTIKVEKLIFDISENNNFKVFSSKNVKECKSLKLESLNSTLNVEIFNEFLNLRVENKREIRNINILPKIANPEKLLNITSKNISIFTDFESINLHVKSITQDKYCIPIKIIPSKEIITLFYHIYDFENTKIYSFIFENFQELRKINEKLYVENDDVKNFFITIDNEINNLKIIHDEEILHNFNITNKSDLVKRYTEEVIYILFLDKKNTQINSYCNRKI
jgi:hypothetical protein